VSGSWRDPDSSVYVSDRVLRGMTAPAAADWEALTATEFFPRLLQDGKVVDTASVDVRGRPPDAWSPRAEPWALWLEHDRVPIVSYPYEWSFSMLRDAALAHLDVLLAALDEGFTLKDGSAYNVQFVGSRPVFIDIGSFQPLTGPWEGYSQFCRTMLYPLLLGAHLGVPFQPLLRGRLDGLRAVEVAGLFRGLTRYRPGVLRNVLVQSFLERHASAPTGEVREALVSAGYDSRLVAAVARKLRRLVGRLSATRRASHWLGYRANSGYGEDDLLAKDGFVREALGPGAPHGLVLDLGTNDGRYAELAAATADHVVAVDADEAVIDDLYRRLRARGDEQILPLVLDVADMTGGLGWRGRERVAFDDRCRPDVVLALALVHHLVVGANVPLGEVVDWLAGFGARLVVEFAHPDDPMVRHLLGGKNPRVAADYRRELFEERLGERCRIEAAMQLPLGTRTLYVATPR